VNRKGDFEPWDFDNDKHYHVSFITSSSIQVSLIDAQNCGSSRGTMKQSRFALLLCP
jgi:hypothetical protein